MSYTVNDLMTFYFALLDFHRLTSARSLELSMFIFYELSNLTTGFATLVNQEWSIYALKSLVRITPAIFKRFLIKTDKWHSLPNMMLQQTLVATPMIQNSNQFLALIACVSVVPANSNLYLLFYFTFKSGRVAIAALRTASQGLKMPLWKRTDSFSPRSQ
jgi:hypothetical protein